ncbi:MAG TPA: nitroreductase family protein [bacterium]|nr:nitroreductase family protein [bacterium]
MELLTAIRGRRSVRCFQNRPVPPELLPTLIEAMLWAPSAGNHQSRHFTFVTAADQVAKVAATCAQAFVATAPLLLVACADRRLRRKYGSRGADLYAPLDVALAVQNYMLAAHACGLGTVWVASFREPALRRVLQLPAQLRPIAIVPTGYAAATPAVPPRRPPDENVAFR